MGNMTGSQAEEELKVTLILRIGGNSAIEAFLGYTCVG